MRWLAASSLLWTSRASPEGVSFWGAEQASEVRLSPLSRRDSPTKD